MKKNFFKKLSFVLALAMIVTALAPAAGAFAAEDLHLNSTKKYLHLAGGEQGANDFNFNIHGDKQKGWKYEWTSSDEAVADVASNGVTTAIGKGTATITCDITDKDGEDVDSLTATVTVRDNIKSITEIYMQTADVTDFTKLAVATDYDFGRKFETYSGSTTKTSAITRWILTPATGATINAAGVFNATAAGKYTITALAFQSTEKYNAWVAAKDPASTLNVLASKTLDVTVVPSIKSTKQIDNDTFEVTFDSDMSKSDIATASVLYKMVAGKPSSTGTEKIKKVTFDTATGKVATIDTYVAFTADTDYKFVYGTLIGTFKTSVKKLANITGITFSDFDVTYPTPKDMLASIVAYDVNGVGIYTGTELYAISPSYLSFTYKGEPAKGSISGTNAYVYIEGYAAQIDVKFSAAVYDETAKTYKTLTFSDSAFATGKKTDSNISGASLMFAAPLATDGTAAADLTYSATDVTVAAKDSNKIVVKYALNNALDTAVYQTTGTTLTFKTLDTDKLLISGNYMYPITAGTATVIVYSGDKAIGAFDVKIVAARALGSATPEAGKEVLTVGNSAVETGSSAKVYVKDTLDKSIDSAITATPLLVNGPTGTAPSVTAVKTEAGVVTVTATAGTTTTVGAYVYKITIGALSSTKEVFFTVNVVEATTASAQAVAYYQLQLGKDSQDVKGVTGSSISVNVYGYNSAGVKVKHLVAGTEYEAVVKNAGGDVISSATNTTIPVVSNTAGAVTAYATGTYVVTISATGGAVRIGDVVLANGTYLAAGTLTVTDTTTKTFSVDSFGVTATNVTAAVTAAFGFKVNDTDCEVLANGFTLDSIEYSTGSGVIAKQTVAYASAATGTVASGNSIYVAAVYFTKTVGGYTFTYKIDVNRSVTIN